METKFSPGPHLVSSTFIVCDKEARILANCIPMTEVPTLAPTIEQAQANTILFGAAEALLEACIDVESKIVDFEAGKINWRPDDFLFRVRAAIAKATSQPYTPKRTSNAN